MKHFRFWVLIPTISIVVLHLCLVGVIGWGMMVVETEQKPVKSFRELRQELATAKAARDAALDAHNRLLPDNAEKDETIPDRVREKALEDPEVREAHDYAYKMMVKYDQIDQEIKSRKGEVAH
jgi:hypothetical protein